MPGILLNRLSRPKGDETPAQQLAKGRAILLDEMLPTIHPDAREGEDYIYLESIISRLVAHEDGELLHRALTVMQQGRCTWLAVTEIARLTGDMETAGKIIRLCEQHRIRLYTRERARHPYEAWRAESKQELVMAFAMASLEVVGYQGRIQRARAAAYPLDPVTGESRMRSIEGLGRYMNGTVPQGYVWDPASKCVLPDTTIPCPGYVPPEATLPPAYTLYEIVQRLRVLGRRWGAQEALYHLERETGFRMDTQQAVRIWHNPFYAGRPTSFWMSQGGKKVRRDEPVATVGKYEAMESWAEHLELQQAIVERRQGGVKTGSDAWASGLIRCECGQPWISEGKYYRCRGMIRYIKQTSAERRWAKGHTGFVERHRIPESWERTPTCGCSLKKYIHAIVEEHLRALFARPKLLEEVAAFERARRDALIDRKELLKKCSDLEISLRKLGEQRQRLIDLAVDGAISGQELKARQAKMDQERAGLDARLCQLQETLAVPPVSLHAIEILQQIAVEDFDALWHDPEILSESDKAVLARAVLDYIPVKGKAHRREFGEPVWAPGL